jgi:hypothetical protein
MHVLVLLLVLLLCYLINRVGCPHARGMEAFSQGCFRHGSMEEMDEHCQDTRNGTRALRRGTINRQVSSKGNLINIPSLLCKHSPVVQRNACPSSLVQVLWVASKKLLQRSAYRSLLAAIKAPRRSERVFDPTRWRPPFSPIRPKVLECPDGNDRPSPQEAWGVESASQ